MSSGKDAGPALMAVLVVLAAMCILLIAMGNYAVGIALLTVAIALFPSARQAMKTKAGADTPEERS